MEAAAQHDGSFVADNPRIGLARQPVRFDQPRMPPLRPRPTNATSTPRSSPFPSPVRRIERFRFRNSQPSKLRTA
jgi:hypothetical protein